MLNLRARVTGSGPCERDVRGRLFGFYDWCAQNDDIPELVNPGPDDLPVGRRDRRRGADGSHERQLRGAQPGRETGSPQGIFLPQPGEPAPPRPDRLHRSTLEAEYRRLAAVELLIIDDFALQPLTPAQTTDFYEIITERHRKASTVVTSNRDAS